MKVLMINKFLYPNGGSETYMFELGKQLERMGHEVQYFGMEHEGRCVGNRVDAYTGSILQGQRITGQTEAPAASAVGIESAKTAALNHAGLSAASVTFTKTKQDWEDGRLEYDIEFLSGDWEYDYTVSASGAILDWEREPLEEDDAHHASAPSSADIGAQITGIQPLDFVAVM